MSLYDSLCVFMYQRLSFFSFAIKNPTFYGFLCVLPALSFAFVDVCANFVSALSAFYDFREVFRD